MKKFIVSIFLISFLVSCAAQVNLNQQAVIRPNDANFFTVLQNGLAKRVNQKELQDTFSKKILTDALIGYWEDVRSVSDSIDFNTIRPFSRFGSTLRNGWYMYSVTTESNGINTITRKLYNVGINIDDNLVETVTLKNGWQLLVKFQNNVATHHYVNYGGFTTIDYMIDLLSQRITAEQAARIAADNVINTNLATKAAQTSLNNTNAQVQKNIDSLAQHRVELNQKATKTELSNLQFQTQIDLNAEAAARAAADNAINAEVLKNHFVNKNLVLGDGALSKMTSSGHPSIAIGDSTLAKNPTPHGSIAIGQFSQKESVVGGDNTSVGVYSMLNHVTGNANTALGKRALGSQKIGMGNTALGFFAMQAANNNNYNTGVGYFALLRDTASSFSVGIGAFALSSNQADNNVGVGAYASFSNTYGLHTVSIGARSAQNNTIGNRNISIGYKSLFSNVSGSDNVTIGDSSSYNTTGNNNIAIGNNVQFANPQADNQINIGNWIIGSNYDLYIAKPLTAPKRILTETDITKKTVVLTMRAKGISTTDEADAIVLPDELVGYTLKEIKIDNFSGGIVAGQIARPSARGGLYTQNYSFTVAGQLTYNPALLISSMNNAFSVTSNGMASSNVLFTLVFEK